MCLTYHDSFMLIMNFDLLVYLLLILMSLILINYSFLNLLNHNLENNAHKILQCFNFALYQPFLNLNLITTQSYKLKKNK